MPPRCIDLLALAESRRWRWRQAAEAPAGNRDPWLYEIPCRLGVIYPWGGDLLCLHVEEHGPTRNRLRAIPGVESYQRGDAEEVFRFAVDHLDAVAEIAEPKRKRSAEAAERLAPHRFVSSRARVQTQESTPETALDEIPAGTASGAEIVVSGGQEPPRR